MTVLRDLAFVLAIWRSNLLSAMEYRASFVTQILGMMLNDAVYFAFWLVFFQRFDEVQGWGIKEMFVLFGIVTVGFGMAAMLFGNVMMLSEIIVEGQLDYYLSLPRPALLHLMTRRSYVSGLGDLTYGLLSFVLAGQWTAGECLRFVLGSIISMVVFISFLIAIQSLSFWLGDSRVLSDHAASAILTFSLYPITLFDGTAKFLLLAVVPAAFVGAIPAKLVEAFSWREFGYLGVAAVAFFSLAMYLFHRGLHRYEGGSVIRVQT